MYKYSLDNAKETKNILEEDIKNFFENLPTLNICINHKDFIIKWLLTNEGYFDDFDNIIKLINLTTTYITVKNNNSIKNLLYFKNGTTIKNKTLSEIADRNIERLKKVKEDLDSLTIHSCRTKNLINEIDNFILSTDNYIPHNKSISKCNVEGIRKYLKKLKVKDTSIVEYITYFQNLNTTS